MFAELERSSFGTLNPCNLSALLMVTVHLVRYAVVMYHTHKACNQNLDNCVDMFFEIYVERVI